ncbi:hypothetical protein Catovirus_1_55 [Catovirus CTV1]|uniref:Uncharacterized protein n=1 Tax=Catovirus CTV1 TaxID=1977631 RepID=A0A1V0S8H1_9VIRU|nr:hypothetical protein Catovirus_1_55 [Catovirus CTV1]
MENNITLDEKIRLLKLHLDNLNDENKINIFFDIYKNNVGTEKEIIVNDKKINNAEVKSNKPKELDKNSHKYIIFLKLLNEILVANEMSPINDIYEFKNMTKEQLIKNKEANKLFGLKEEIFKKKEGFSKNMCQWYARRKIDNYIISFLKGACEELGVTLESKYAKKVNNNKIVNFAKYSIK